MSKRSEVPVVLPPGINHGNASTYNNYKCGCVDCKAAWAAYNRPRIKKWRTRKRRERQLTKEANASFERLLNEGS